MSTQTYHSDQGPEKEPDEDVMLPVQREIYDQLLLRHGATLPEYMDRANAIHLMVNFSRRSLQCQFAIDVLKGTKNVRRDSVLGEDVEYTQMFTEISRDKVEPVIFGLSQESRKIIAAILITQAEMEKSEELESAGSWQKIAVLTANARAIRDRLLKAGGDIPQETICETPEWLPEKPYSLAVSTAEQMLCTRLRSIMRKDPRICPEWLKLVRTTHSTFSFDTEEDGSIRVELSCGHDIDDDGNEHAVFTQESKLTIRHETVAEALNSMKRGMPRQMREILACHLVHLAYDIKQFDEAIAQDQENNEESDDEDEIMRDINGPATKGSLKNASDGDIRKFYENVLNGTLD